MSSSHALTPEGVSDECLLHVHFVVQERYGHVADMASDVHSCQMMTEIRL